jgi:hypothetical protein
MACGHAPGKHLETHALELFQENWVRFAKFRLLVSPPLLWRLAKSDAWSATVLVDELDAIGIKGVPGQTPGSKHEPNKLMRCRPDPKFVASSLPFI